MTTTHYQHPAKLLVPVTEALASWTDGALFSEKLDGCFEVREWHGNTLAGEAMPGGNFIAWDLLATADGGDVSNAPAIDRLTALVCAREHLEADGIGLVQFTVTDGAALLRDVLARGGEGVVRKELDATYFTPMLAAKRSIIVQCRVTGIGPGQAIEVADIGGDLGRCPAKGGACDKLRVGSIVRVEAALITKNHKLREPKLCREFLVQF